MKVSQSVLAILLISCSIAYAQVCSNLKDDKSCARWKLYKYCTTGRYVKYMKKYCEKECGYCTPATTSAPGSTSVPLSTSTPQKIDCGKTKMTGRVIAGQDSKQGQWPWQIAMYRSGRFSCGGTLIAPQWVVTAAHCVTRNYPSTYKIVLGDLNRSSNSGIEKTHLVERIISHPKYHSPSRLNNDIALMKLKTPVVMNDNISPACLPKANDNVPVGSKCYISGWGKIKHPGSSTNKLQHAMLTVMDSTECNKLNGRYNRIEKQMVCAANKGQRQSGCHGDSGGPFVCQGTDGRWVLQGAVSWGSPRCDTTLANTVFARVSEFRSWIDENMKKFA